MMFNYKHRRGLAGQKFSKKPSKNTSQKIQTKNKVTRNSNTQNFLNKKKKMKKI